MDRMGLSIAHISPAFRHTPAPLAVSDDGPEPGRAMDAEGWREAGYVDPADLADDGTMDLPIVPLPCLQVARGGNLMKLQGRSQYGAQRGGGRRGDVRGLSRQARKRLLEFVASLSRETDPRKWLFITLTYPREYPSEARDYKRHLDIFCKRLSRLDKQCSAIWKLEFQERGAPHYHVLLYGRAHLDYRWLRIAWFESVASGDHIHLVAGTQVDAVQSWNGVAWYAAKYIGKVVRREEAQHTGRCWGVFRRAMLPREIVDLPVGWGEFHGLRRAMRRYGRGSKAQPWCPDPHGKRRGYLHRASGAYSGMSLFVPEKVASRLMRCLPDLAETEAGTDPARHKSSFREWAVWIDGLTKSAPGRTVRPAGRR